MQTERRGSVAGTFGGTFGFFQEGPGWSLEHFWGPQGAQARRTKGSGSVAGTFMGTFGFSKWLWLQPGAFLCPPVPPTSYPRPVGAPFLKPAFNLSQLNF